MPTLSIVIPAHNEERFLGTLLERIVSADLGATAFTKEIVVVDDGCTDRTAAIAADAGVRVERLPQRRGKGAAVRRGFEVASGEYVLIQDADLEYDPRDHAAMVAALVAGRADVIYGSRYLSEGRRPGQSVAAYAAGRSFTPIAYLTTGVWLTDVVSALKLLPRDLALSLGLQADGFEIDQEITAKVLARGARIHEVPVRYQPRTRAEGKKIGARDWVTGIRTLVRFRRR